jgi:hypothetical protein
VSWLSCGLVVAMQFLGWYSSLSRVGHCRGHKVVEDTVLVLKELGYSGARKAHTPPQQWAECDVKRKACEILRLESHGHLSEENLSS